MESSEERFKVGLQNKCSKGDFWRGILALLGFVLCIPSTIFYIRGDKRSVTSFVELLLLSVGAFLLAFSILSTVLGCIRMGQNRRKLENLLDETRHEDVLQWIHQHHRMHNSKSFKIFSPKNIEHFYYFCRILTIVQNFRNLSCSTRVVDCALALFALVMTRPSNVKSGLRK